MTVGDVIRTNSKLLCSLHEISSQDSGLPYSRSAWPACFRFTEGKVFVISRGPTRVEYNALLSAVCTLMALMGGHSPVLLFSLWEGPDISNLEHEDTKYRYDA